MRNESLQALVEKVSLTYFNKPFEHKAIYNSRLKTTGGRYHLADHHLDFNPKIMEKYGEEELVKIIIHELCHYHLHLEGKGYKHQDKAFKQLLKITGGSRYAPPLKEATWLYYSCLSCQKEFKRQRQVNVTKYGCPCGGRLKRIDK